MLSQGLEQVLEMRRDPCPSPWPLAGDTRGSFSSAGKSHSLWLLFTCFFAALCIFPGENGSVMHISFTQRAGFI